MIYIYLLCKHQLYIICSFQYSELCGLTLQKFVLIDTVFYVTRRVFFVQTRFPSSLRKTQREGEANTPLLKPLQISMVHKNKSLHKNSWNPDIFEAWCDPPPHDTQHTHTHKKKKSTPQKILMFMCIYSASDKTEERTVVNLQHEDKKKARERETEQHRAVVSCRWWKIWCVM